MNSSTILRPAPFGSSSRYSRFETVLAVVVFAYFGLALLSLGSIGA
jgi:hypothetical protein